MKTCNRRDFLKWTGMSALALTLAACSDGPSAPAAPAVPAKDAQALFAAINADRKGRGVEELVYNKNLETLARQYTSCFEKQQVTSADFDKWCSDTTVNPDAEKFQAELNQIQSALSADGFVGSTVIYGLEESGDNWLLNAPYPETETERKQQLEEFAEKFDGMRYIGISLATVKGKTYWVASLLPKKA